MDWDQLMGTVYMAIDSIKNGDIDEAEIVREWDNLEDDTREGFQLVLRRDVLGRHEASKVDEALEGLRKQH